MMTTTSKLAIPALLAASIFGNLQQSGRLEWLIGQDKTQPAYLVSFCVEQVGTLREGCVVRYGGWDVGRVRYIEFRPKQLEFHVVLALNQPLMLPADSTAQLREDPLTIGGAVVELRRGQSPQRLELALGEPRELRGRASIGMADLTDQLHETVTELHGAVQDLRLTAGTAREVIERVQQRTEGGFFTLAADYLAGQSLLRRFLREHDVRTINEFSEAWDTFSRNGYRDVEAVSEASSYSTVRRR